MLSFRSPPTNSKPQSSNRHRAAGPRFERGLAARIVADVVDQPGALPLLQYALTELFERHDAGVLTTGAYEALGGLTGVIAQRGEQLYTAASDDEQTAIRRLFTRLVTWARAPRTLAAG